MPLASADRERRFLALGTTTLALLLGACGGNVMTRDVGVADVTDQSTVRADDDRASGCDGTFFTDWGEATSDAIAAASRDGLVAVRVQGCKLEVVAACRPEGSYDFVAVTPSRDAATVSQENAIAIGVEGRDDKTVGASAGLGRSRSVDYAVVGQQIAKAAPKSTSGDCARATHWVSTISVGAYELTSSQHTEVSAIVKVHEHDAKKRHAEGDIDRCSKTGASSDESCRTPLKIELKKLP
jgi:hypothetical protein